MDIQNKVAIVTGGASGLGLETVRHLLQKGARVVIFDLNEELAKKVTQELGENVTYEIVNVADEESVHAAIQQTVEKFGAIHICVNCAGIAPPQKTVGKNGAMPLENFKKVIDINLIGSFNTLRLAAVEMIKNETLTDSGERGVIINTASVAAFEGQMGQAAYSASKAGIVGMTLPIARDLSANGIRINAIAPGLFRTPMAAGLDDRVIEKLESLVEFPKRLGRPEEFASLVAFMIENEYINGEVIRLDGAIRMQPR
ncbi:NAD(P)-dependent dehydrogenase, short-chain alcohol dehydrogenase family [Psychrobacillus sp. OK028]|uniref:3-hydroxyacyl-CoA dehydrogenase n=1 Tax=Psychrobacillus sp. OK028 TaxID=1884359 RepID=UPI00087EBAD6|nr:3-hydroxyacyl-CoA dehydrogenase [Psychrobacillus sp. OK028]SDN30215.1 NAD(P)-dependent dehydrogenase, short-chain alcohol dehydrogenase family [Psychrobacillus sp. OK028]